jgi:nitrogen-specific signal transduction histidine kinase
LEKALQIGRRTQKKSTPILILGLTVVVFGLGMSFLTWQNLKGQKEAAYDNMLQSARSLMRGVEAGIVRDIRTAIMQESTRIDEGGAVGGSRILRRLMLFPPAIRPRVEELMEELVGTGDVLSIALYAPDGVSVIGPVSAEDELFLPGVIRGEHLEQANWQEVKLLEGREVLTAGTRVRPSLARLIINSPTPFRRPDPLQAPVLVAVFSTDSYLEKYRKYQRAAMLQTVYVLLTAALLMALGTAYMRRRAKSAAYERLEHFHSVLLDNMPDGLMTVGREGTVRAANPAALSIFEDVGPSVVGRPFSDIKLQYLDDTDSDKAARYENSPWKHCAYGGRDLEILTTPLTGPDPGREEEGGRLVLIRDRTDLKALEDDLNEAERLAAIGRLAAGLAHEIRNPLSALRGFAQYFAGKLAGRNPEEQYAKTMVEEADRLNRVVTDLMFLAKPREPQMEAIPVAGMVEELVRLMQFDLERLGASITSDVDEVQVFADRDMLKQALLNLVMNALKALPEVGGIVSISTDAEGPFQCIQVQDNGAGMSEDVRSKAMEPFFTTRSEGTGLGLSIVHKIMRDHRGRLDIDSAPGKGTTATLCFPKDAGEEQSS